MQHQPIGIKLKATITPRSVPFRSGYNLRKADWKNWAGNIDVYIADITITPDNRIYLIRISSQNRTFHVDDVCLMYVG